MMLRGYEFKKYKKKKKAKEDEDEDPSSLNSVRILCNQPQEATAEFVALRAVGEGVTLARDLVNEPPNMLYPEEFARRVQALASDGLEVEVLDQSQLAAIGMNAILAVGQGSARASCVAIMRWNGGPAALREAAGADRQGCVLRYRRHIDQAGGGHGGYEG